MTDKTLLELIEAKGRLILENIDATDTVKTKTNGKEGNAARSYYSVSKILLEVEKVNDARGKAGEAEISQALAKHAKMLRLPKPYKTVRKQIEERERAYKTRKTMAFNAPDIAEMLDLLQKLLSMLVMAFAAYKSGKEIVKQAKQKRKAKKNVSKSSQPS